MFSTLQSKCHYVCVILVVLNILRLNINAINPSI